MVLFSSLQRKKLLLVSREKAVSPRTKEGVGSFGNPVGTIIAFAGFNAPNGYLICNGEKITQGIQNIQGQDVDLTLLYDVVGTYYSGNGVDHTLPDLRGEFLRGYSGATDNTLARDDVDINREFGQHQVDSSQNLDCQTDVQEGGGDHITLYGVKDTLANTKNAETRPRNIAINYCIKY